MNPTVTLNVIMVNSKRDLSFINQSTYTFIDFNDMEKNDFLYSSESDLLSDIRSKCAENKVSIINKVVDISLPTIFSYQGNIVYRIDIMNSKRKSFKVNGMIFYIVLPDGRASIANTIESHTDFFILPKRENTTILVSIEDNFSITSVKQLYKTNKARIGLVGAKHPILFAYNKMDKSPEQLMNELCDEIMHIKYRSIAGILKRISMIIGKDIEPIQDRVSLDIGYDLNRKEFLISKSQQTLPPIWFNILVEVELRKDGKYEVSAVLTADRIIIPDYQTLHIHSPSDMK